MFFDDLNLTALSPPPLIGAIDLNQQRLPFLFILPLTFKSISNHNPWAHAGVNHHINLRKSNKLSLDLRLSHMSSIQMDHSLRASPVSVLAAACGVLQLEPFQADVGDTIQVEEVLQLSDDDRRAFALRLQGNVAELGLEGQKNRLNYIQCRIIGVEKSC